MEACAKEVLTWLGRSVQNNNNVEFVFPELGRLSIKLVVHLYPKVSQVDIRNYLDQANANSGQMASERPK